MKRFILSVSALALGITAFAPVAFASSQASTPDQISPEATIHDLVLHNRGVRDK